MSHHERHRTDKIGWMRAAVLGANDGLISTSSLIAGVAAAEAERGPILIAGIAGLVAGAFSMAAGEYVSVSSQSDTERADIERERRELIETPEAEEKELAGIYEERGLSPELAARVARELTEHDALGAHMRDELGIVEEQRARPIQAAWSSGAAFSIGAALPVLITAFAPRAALVPGVTGATVLLLAGLGAYAAWLGGASLARGAIRVTFWGVVAMAATTLIGHLVGAAV